jgi:hypothetical protein
MRETGHRRARVRSYPGRASEIVTDEKAPPCFRRGLQTPRVLGRSDGRRRALAADLERLEMEVAVAVMDLALLEEADGLI